RMELVDLATVLFNPDAQAKFVHTVSAGYLTGAMFVLSISSWYLLRGRDVAFARRSFRIAAAFGLASALSVIVLGDESGYTVGEAQQTKLAAMEAMWETEPAPAGLKLVAGIDEAKMRNSWELEIPWLLGLIGTRSLDRPLPGLKDILATNRARIVSGIVAVEALAALRQAPDDTAARARFEAHRADLGFGLLLRKQVADVSQATPAQIDRAARDSLPRVTPLFWSFRLMVGLGFLMLALFATAAWSSVRGRIGERRWLLHWALWSLPLPWIACEVGWIVAELGRQPWTIYGILPTHLSVSSLSVGTLYGSLAGFAGFYAVLVIIEMALMLRFARMGPASLGTGRYHGETAHA
ncbi:MAG: cytochrome ubiquinol oxidase subunit I, partial [Rhodocyclaceae bacterium]|nr:cytochrome ubiquinol oxidase subunit I [Rhodocyclaceae bacterium]